MKKILNLIVLCFILSGCLNNNETSSGQGIDEPVEDGHSSNQDKDEETEQKDDEIDIVTDSEEGMNEDELDNNSNNLSAEPVVHTETLEREEGTVEVGVSVYPIERKNELALFTVEFEKKRGNAEVDLDHIISHPSTERTSGNAIARGNEFDRLGYQIRLFDNDNDTISHTLFHQEYAEDRGEQYLSTKALKSEKVDSRSFNNGEVVSYSAIFDAPLEESIHVMIEGFDLILDVPVIESDEVIETAQSLLEDNILDTTSVKLEDLSEQVYPLQTYNESVEAPVGTLVEEQQASITLDADVLFEFDSSDLQDKANSILEATAEELRRVNGGELTIIGHTDDQGTEEYNQELSEDRAQSVFNQLEDIIDLNEFDSIVIEGKSFNEPVASNESEEGQQLNRRVELQFSQPDSMVEVTEEEFELPDNLGPVVSYEENEYVEVDYNNRIPFGVSIDSLKRMDGYIIGRVRLHNFGDRASHIHNPVNTGYAHGARSLHVDGEALTSGGLLDNYDADGVTLLYGNKRVFPIDYWGLTVNDNMDKEQEELVPLVSRNVREGTRNNLGSEGSMVVTIIWPNVPGETITVDKAPSDNFEENLDSYMPYLVPWRIVDVPIEG